MILLNRTKKKNYQKKKSISSLKILQPLSEQIKTVWDKIQQHDFYTGCGKPDCHWCDFVKTNNMAVELHEANEEEV